MRIIYFHQHFSTPKGSSGTRSYEFARRAIEAGHEVTVVCGSYSQGNTGLTEPFVNGKRRGKIEGIDVIELDLAYSNADGLVRRARTFLRFAWQSVLMALREPYDVCFATSTPLTAAIPGIAAKWLRRKPFVFEVRDLWPELPKAMGVVTNPVVLGLLKLLELSAYRSADRVIALSPGIAAGVIEGGLPADRVELVPNGCDLALFGPSEDQHRLEDIPRDTLLAVFAGTHGQANGLQSVLRGAAELQARGRTDIVIAMIGDGKTKPALVEAANEMGLANVRFVDPLPKIQLARTLAACDVGIQCLANVPAFYYGTSPNKFFDYLASGLPVLNNYPGWVAELVTTNSCGYVAEPDDPAAFADALERAASDREARISMGRNARALAEREFDRDRLAQRWLDCVESVAP
ncbi:MAG: glycosyltransferase family 4 protein [Erythrobacter sp.]|nr:glycosyltransferase family 4 protein [Erythrobacter sp.]